MTAAIASGATPDSRRASQRLVVAVAASFLLHVALMLGLPVNPTGGVPAVNSVITARLEPAAEEQPAPEATAEPAAAAGAQAPSLPDPLGEPVTRKAEPERKAAPAAPSTPSAGLEIPLARDPTYYLVKELDVIPRPLAIIQPQCPAGALSDRVNGGVELALLINEFGMVDDVSVINAQPAGYFEDVGMAAFRPARFAPAEKQGRPVKARVNIRVKFEC
jgi:protein TonB